VSADVIAAAQRLVAAADACDREAERHPSSRSAAPMVRYVDAMGKLRRALKDRGGDAKPGAGATSWTWRDGMLAAIRIVRSRRQSLVDVTHPSYLAALDEMLIRLEGALDRGGEPAETVAAAQDGAK
jgi:hypothetical protein